MTCAICHNPNCTGLHLTVSTSDVIELDKLRAENAKLRESLERIYRMPISERKWSTAMDIAATALGIV